MTEVMSYNQQSNNFASVIQNINLELQQKGHLKSDEPDSLHQHSAPGPPPGVDGQMNVTIPGGNVNVPGVGPGPAVPPAGTDKMLEDTSPTTARLLEHRQLLNEMRAQNFDVIRFATYRTACKLRFVQKKTNLFLVDLWNMIEAFRENGLNSLEPGAEVNHARLDALLATVFHGLNKRLPTAAQIHAEHSAACLHNWMLAAFDGEGSGRIRIMSMKVALATMCSGKLMDKLRYIFTLVSDTQGYLVRNKFEEFLREVLTLPTAVYEGPSFGYNDTAARACFDGRSRVNVNDFLDTLMSDPGPQCLLWLPILHRMAQVENVFHPIQCEGCHRESFMGFRYKCQRCYNYHLCQDCFWRGRTSGNHANEHDVKEYSSWKSPAKQLTHSLRKSFRCVPQRANHRIPQFPDQPEKTLDLTHVVPATPVAVHNGFHDSTRSLSVDLSSMESSSVTKSPSKLVSGGSLDTNRIDDEHRLIARYAARLAADANNAARSPSELNFSLDTNRAQRELIAQLEAKNRDILNEIQRLRKEQEAAARMSADGASLGRNPTLLAELRLLRQRRDELEARMAALQESRRELMVQLEGLMKLLKTHGSPRSTPNSSPRARHAHSPPLGLPALARTSSASSNPGDSLMGVGGDVRQAFGQAPGSSTSSVRSLRQDLLVAADSVTNAMSSLVKELNSEASSGEEDDDDDAFSSRQQGGVGGGGGGEDAVMLDDLGVWRRDMQQRMRQDHQFIAEIGARKHNPNASDPEPEHYISAADGSYLQTAQYVHDTQNYVRNNVMNKSTGGHSTDDSYVRTDEEDAELYDHDPKALQGFVPSRYMTDEDSFGVETDQESYIRTDDEDGGNTDWEENMRRWVNR